MGSTHQYKPVWNDYKIRLVTSYISKASQLSGPGGFCVLIKSGWLSSPGLPPQMANGTKPGRQSGLHPLLGPVIVLKFAVIGLGRLDFGHALAQPGLHLGKFSGKLRQSPAAMAKAAFRLH